MQNNWRGANPGPLHASLLFLPFLLAQRRQTGTYSNYGMGCYWEPLYTPARIA